MTADTDHVETKRGPGRKAVSLVAGVVALIGLAVFAVIVLRDPPTGDPGQLFESLVELPTDTPRPALVDATNVWGLADLGLVPAVDKMAGGAASADVDGDGKADLIIANGDVAVTLWRDGKFDPPVLLGVTEAIGVTAADLDADGAVDLLIATATDADLIIWGGDWPLTAATPAVTELVAPGATSALLAGELTGDASLDIVRLGRDDNDEPVPDIVFSPRPDDPRLFVGTDLPVPDRYSLAGELVDVDRDGLLDIWITRDVGWARGGDSVLSRRGNPAGKWYDIATELGVALEVDGMGITVADLNGDSRLDAYVSDLGDNEQLLGARQGFNATTNTGAAHIRPPGAPEDLVSSTWGTGAIDINLDGILDLVLASGGFPEGSIRNKIDNTTVALAEPPSILLGVGDGRFAEVWPSLGIDRDIVARGMIVADVDADGDDDVVIVDRRGNIVALRNDTHGPSITVAATEDCRDWAGAVVTIRTSEGSFQRLLTPHGYASGHGASVSVGNPVEGLVDVVTEWPGADLDRFVVERPGRVFASLNCP